MREAELPMCSSCMCNIEYVHMCLVACLGLGDTHPPIGLETICLQFYQQLRIAENKATEVQPTYQFCVHWGVSNLSKCSFSIGFFKAANIVSELYWTSCEFNKDSSANKCWNVRPSCSSHLVECTKTWMMSDLSSVLWDDRMLSLKLDSQPTLVLPWRSETSTEHR